jgi:hypothetical protein
MKKNQISNHFKATRSPHVHSFFLIWFVVQEAEAKASNENEDSAELVNERETQ